MENNTNLKKKSQLLRDIRGTVARYGEQYGLAMPLGLLNRKFAKRAQPFGGVNQLMQDLEKQGMLFAHMLRSGAVIVSTEEISSKPSLALVKR